MRVWIVRGHERYENSWIDSVFDSEPKAMAMAEKLQTEADGEENEYIYTVDEYEVF